MINDPQRCLVVIPSAFTSVPDNLERGAGSCWFKTSAAGTHRGNPGFEPGYTGFCAQRHIGKVVQYRSVEGNETYIDRGLHLPTTEWALN